MMAPSPYQVAPLRQETRETPTLTLEPCFAAIAPTRPGQFTMLYVFGVGESPISVGHTGPLIEHTIRDIVLVAGGIGLTPPRSALLHALGHRDAYGDIALLLGARTPEDLLYGPEMADWRERGVRLEATTDRASEGWEGSISLVTTLIGPLDGEFTGAAAFHCGPEIMLRTPHGFARRG